MHEFVSQPDAFRPFRVVISGLIAQVKRTSSWNKACDELRRHQELLEQKRQATNNFTNYESSEDDLDDELDDDEDEVEVKVEKKSEDVDDEEEDLDEEVRSYEYMNEF